MKYYLNIGSNQGNPRANILKAIVKLSAGFGGAEVSHMVESTPWGFESPHTFLNVGIAITSSLEPQLMLDHIHDIERQVGTSPHRNPDGSYRDREIDIDIMAIDDLIIDSPTLTVPHPFMHKRNFFLVPMNELNPAWIHPTLHLTTAQMLENFTNEEI